MTDKERQRKIDSMTDEERQREIDSLNMRVTTAIFDAERSTERASMEWAIVEILERQLMFLLPDYTAEKSVAVRGYREAKRKKLVLERQLIEY